MNFHLPNILGTTSWFAGSSDQSGAFAKDTSTANHYGTNVGGTEPKGATFDASRSSIIYGSSSTVQPNSTRVSFIIKY